MACRSSTPISADRATTTEENAVLTHPMLDQLSQLGLSGMAQAFAELEASDETAALTHADWLGLWVDRELTHRRDKRLAARLRYARLRQQASVEDVDYRAPRGLDRALFHKLTNGEWIDTHDNLILCGPTGVGKSRQLGDRPVPSDRRQRHLRLEPRIMLLPCPLHVLLPRYPRVLGAGLHLSQLSHFRGPPH